MFTRGILCVFLLASWSPAQTGAWRSIWNGKDLDGWQHVGAGEFVVEDGALKASGVKGKLGLLVYTRETLGNCVLRVVYKGEADNSNSGVYIRIPEKPAEPVMPIRRAHEVQIMGRHTGEIYARTKADVAPHPAGEWNTLEITMDGPRTIVVLNGVKVTDYREGTVEAKDPVNNEPRPEQGYIGLQNHDADVLWFKEVAVRK